jgi:hypothetical protein
MLSSSSSPSASKCTTKTEFPISKKRPIRDSIENNTIIDYPSSGRRIVNDGKGQIISDSATKKNSERELLQGYQVK